VKITGREVKIGRSKNQGKGMKVNLLILIEELSQAQSY
jgi:hypothetical protein